ncbi:MAG: hypothetical protein ABIH70_05455 [Chloroflexota bacterium]
MSDNPILKRVARTSAWLLLFSIFISVISGWGITQTGIIYQASFGLIDRGAANAIHRGLQIPMAAFFLVHILTNVKIGLAARYKPVVVNAVLIIVGILLLIGVIYMETR